MFAYGYPQQQRGRVPMSPRGNNFHSLPFQQRAMTPTRGRTPLANRSLIGGLGNQFAQNFQLPSRSLHSSFNSHQPAINFSPQRPLTQSNLLQKSMTQFQQIPNPMQNQIIKTKEFIPQKGTNKPNLNDLYKKAMNRTNETLSRVKQKEARINMVLNRQSNNSSNHKFFTANSPPTSNEKQNNLPIVSNEKISQEYPETPEKEGGKKYVRIELKDGLFEGESFDGKREGFGVLKDFNGNIIYTGYWVNDNFEGKGKAYNQNVESFTSDFHSDFDKVKNGWAWYEGEFKSGMFHGYGTMQLANGDKFSGYFENNKVNGSGNYTFADSQMIVGVWSNNKLETTF